MEHISTKEEAIKYGGLGNRFDSEDMISQCKVMYDNLNPIKDGGDKEDVIRLFLIKEKLVNVIVNLKEIINLNGN